MKHSAYAANQTGASADAAFNHFVAVTEGIPEEPFFETPIPSSDDPIGKAVTEALITRGLLEVVEESKREAQDALNDYRKKAAERKKRQAEQLARLKK